MKIINCVSRAESLFQQECMGMIHSSYKNVINLEIENQIYAIHPKSIAATPISIVVDNWDCSLQELERGQKIKFTKDALKIRENKVTFVKKRFWNPFLNRNMSRDELSALCDGIKKTLPKFAHRGGFSDTVLVDEGNSGDFLTEILREKVREVKKCAEKGREELMFYLKSFLGLGNGLTPSGDDFLVGMLFTYSLLGEEGAAWFELISEAIREELSRTNDISRCFLRCALRQEFGEKFHKLVLEKESESRREQRIEEVADTGHSSGIDTLNGIVCAWEIFSIRNTLREGGSGWKQ